MNEQEVTEEIKIEQNYELSTNCGFFKRVFFGFLLYLMYVFSKKLVLRMTKTYRKPKESNA
jgi:hypothetical protein